MNNEHQNSLKVIIVDGQYFFEFTCPGCEKTTRLDPDDYKKGDSFTCDCGAILAFEFDLELELDKAKQYVINALSNRF